MNKLKRVTFLVFILVVCMILSSTVAFAGAGMSHGQNAKIESKVEKVNQYIYDEIAKAVEKAAKAVEKLIDKPERLDAALDRICAMLIKKTDNKVRILLRKAERFNVEIINGYMEVQIYDRIILVDPCYAH